MLAYLNRAPAARQAARADYLARAARYLLLPVEEYEGLTALQVWTAIYSLCLPYTAASTCRRPSGKGGKAFKIGSPARASWSRSLPGSAISS